MVANKDVSGDEYDALVQELSKLKQQIAAIGRRVPNSLIVGPQGGPYYMQIAPSGWLDVDGQAITTMTIRDDDGNVVFTQFPTTQDGSVGTDWAWAFRDRSGNGLFASDGQAGVGIATPYIPVPYSPRWNGGPFQTATSTGSASMVASSIVGASVLWEGRIGFVSHPALIVDGTWGDVDNAAITPTYSIAVGSVVNTWTAPGGQVNVPHIFDISSLVGTANVTVQVKVTSTGGATGTDRIACHVLGMHMGQTPPAFG